MGFSSHGYNQINNSRVIPTWVFLIVSFPGSMGMRLDPIVWVAKVLVVLSTQTDMEWLITAYHYTSNESTNQITGFHSLSKRDLCPVNWGSICGHHEYCYLRQLQLMW